MQLPQSNILPTNRLCRIFDKTVATYKFYWFIGILDLFVKEGKTKIHIWDLMVEMVVNAWYPVCYFHLSFGKSESLFDAIMGIQQTYQIPINISSTDLRKWLHNHKEDILPWLRFLPINVPYRFLRPWIDTSDDNAVVERSLFFENGCPYKLIKDGKILMDIELNPAWLDYLTQNYIILKEFAFWNLNIFLQIRNPNVPNIPNKIIKAETRNSLSRQHDFWNFVMGHGCAVRCIYTNKELSVGGYDLDHFIPWSFVSHDLIWNLIPADGSINSSKSDKLPDLRTYLQPLAIMQQNAVKTCLSYNFRGQVLEDYLSLGCTPQDLAEMNKGQLFDCFARTFAPMHQIATNMGFEQWRM